jgi:5-deoxy-glucuronate isomerase
VDLDEIYHYRMDHASGYAYHRLYTPDGKRDLTLTVTNGDVVLIRDGYHPVVAGHGYHVYYLNCLAGSARSLANTEDPQHSWVSHYVGNSGFAAATDPCRQWLVANSLNPRGTYAPRG